MYKNRYEPEGTPEGANLKRTELLGNETASEANRSGVDRTGCGLERNGLALRRAAAPLDRTRPDRTGLDRTGLDRTVLRLGEEWSNLIQKGK